MNTNHPPTAPRHCSWLTWFDSQSATDQRVIALNALGSLFAEGKIAFWADDSVDKFGRPIPESETAEEHLYWTDGNKEDLRVPF